MKNTIAIASAFIAASSFSTAEIVVNDFLSFEGFVDSSYWHSDTDSDNPSESGSANSYQVDQVEISWLFNFDTVTAQIDLQYEGDSNLTTGADGELVEQAFVNYALGNGDVITAGRYASMLGFEAFEPTGLYQYSTAYSMSGLPGYAQGVKYTRESDTSFFGISIQDEAFNNGANSLGGNNNDGSYAVELAYSQVLGNGIAVFLGGAYEDGDALGDTYIINAYTTYETGAWLFAAEVNFFKSENILFSFTGADVDVLSGLLMANYAYSDTASVTARVSYEEVDENGAVDEFIKYTLAHNKALAENLALIVEVSYSEFDLDGNTDDADALELAVELLFTF
ncbi:MAG: porin [Opitutales bacterium]|jgi:hypothetical protein|nr:porin [Opitutales bacterium]MDP4693817.1 porin [Opitutales bacterium]MDP4883846.1 porin [Opitutales bacterium]